MRVDQSSNLNFKELIYRTNARRGLGYRLNSKGFNALKVLEKKFESIPQKVILDSKDGSNNTETIRALVYSKDGTYKEYNESIIERILSPLVFIKRVYRTITK